MIVLIPIAGGEDAFKERGYPFCKPLTEVGGRPLIERVWLNLQTLHADRHVFVIRREDARRAHLAEVLRLLDPQSAVVVADGRTAGAACTALLAVEHIELEAELIIANGDQLFLHDLGEVVASFRERKLDAGTITFDSVHPRWSFVRVGADGLVTEAAEKRPISRHATAGFYFFKRGRDFVEAAQAMIRKNSQVNGAYYVCPVFNELILRQSRIGVYSIPRKEYISLATPQNLEEYEQTLANRSGAADEART